jgi:hypothetical protein
MTYLVSCNQESSELESDVLGRQALSSDMIPSIQHSVKKITTSLSALLPLGHKLYDQLTSGLVQAGRTSSARS